MVVMVVMEAMLPQSSVHDACKRYKEKEKEKAKEKERDLLGNDNNRCRVDFLPAVAITVGISDRNRCS